MNGSLTSSSFLVLDLQMIPYGFDGNVVGKRHSTDRTDQLVEKSWD